MVNPSFPYLTLLTFLPALGAFALAFVPGDREVKGGALATSVLVLAIALVMGWQFVPPPDGQLAFAEVYGWVPSLNIRYALGVDGISMLMIALTALLTPMAILASWGITHQAKGFFIAVLLLETGMMGVFSASDLFLFYVFWEVMLLPMALLIGIWGGKRRVYASVKFVLYTMAGSLLMFVAILYAYLASAEQGPASMDIITLQHVLRGALDPVEQRWLFAAFALSFAIKVPMFPVHTWLPDAHVEAPTAGSVILAGVLLKMGSYGFLRFAIPFFPDGAQWMAPAILALSAVGIVYGSLMCLVQTDIKKVIAYSSVAHLGFVMLGIFSGTVIGGQGGVLQMINHGISTGALFLLVGVIYERAHTRGVKDFGGLASVMPVYAVLFLIVTLSSIGLPGLNGFVGEFLILLGTYQTAPVWAIVGATGVILGAVYMLTLYRNIFFGAVNPKWKDLRDTDPIELVSLVPLVVLAVWIGWWPGPWLALTEGPVTKVMNDLQPQSVAEMPAPQRNTP